MSAEWAKNSLFWTIPKLSDWSIDNTILATENRAHIKMVQEAIAATHNRQAAREKK